MIESETTEINTSIVFDRHEQAAIGSDDRSSHILEYSNLAFGMQMIIPKPIRPNPFRWPIRNAVQRHKRMIAQLHNWPLKYTLRSQLFNFFQLFLELNSLPDLRRAGSKTRESGGPPYVTLRMRSEFTRDRGLCSRTLPAHLCLNLSYPYAYLFRGCGF